MILEHFAVPLKLMSFFCLLPLAFVYLKEMGRVWKRTMLVVFLFSLCLSALIDFGLMAGSMITIGILALPLLLSPVVYFIQNRLIRRIERDVGKGSVGVTPTINWTAGYLFLWQE